MFLYSDKELLAYIYEIQHLHSRLCSDLSTLSREESERPKLIIQNQFQTVWARQVACVRFYPLAHWAPCRACGLITILGLGRLRLYRGCRHGTKPNGQADIMQ